MNMGKAMEKIGRSLLSAIVMLVVSIVAFFITIFVVSTGASLAGFEPAGEFVVLSATVLVAASILAGGRA